MLRSALNLLKTYIKWSARCIGFIIGKLHGQNRKLELYMIIVTNNNCSSECKIFKISNPLKKTSIYRVLSPQKVAFLRDFFHSNTQNNKKRKNKTTKINLAMRTEEQWMMNDWEKKNGRYLCCWWIIFSQHVTSWDEIFEEYGLSVKAQSSSVSPQGWKQKDLHMRSERAVA